MSFWDCFNIVVSVRHSCLLIYLNFWRLPSIGWQVRRSKSPWWTIVEFLKIPKWNRKFVEGWDAALRWLLWNSFQSLEEEKPHNGLIQNGQRGAELVRFQLFIDPNRAIAPHQESPALWYSQRLTTVCKSEKLQEKQTAKPPGSETNLRNPLSSEGNGFIYLGMHWRLWMGASITVEKKGRNVEVSH